MKITEIAYSMSIKKQITAYEPMEIFYSMKAEAGDDWKEALSEIRSKVRAVIKAESKTLEVYKRIMSKPLRAASVKEMDEAELEFSANLDKL